jgi:uncharacterized membrane protein YbhN (UPF0104 family)
MYVAGIIRGNYMLPDVRGWRLGITLVALVAGMSLLVWHVRAAGAWEIVRGVASVGIGGGLVILILSLARFYARAIAWLALMTDRIALGRAVRAVIAGDAASNLTPLSLLVGEPAKAAYLRAPSGTAAALTALVTENFFFAVSVALYVVLGTLMMFWRFTVQEDVRSAGLLAIGFMVLVLAGAVVLTRWMKSRLSRRPPAVIAAETVFHVLSFLEMWVSLWLVTGESLPLEALVLDAFGRVANVLFKVVPLQLGVLQVGSELVATAVGLAPGVGTTLSLVRTARVLVWALVGIGLIGKRVSDHGGTEGDGGTEESTLGRA